MMRECDHEWSETVWEVRVSTEYWNTLYMSTWSHHPSNLHQEQSLGTGEYKTKSLILQTKSKELAMIS
jgi:hypothetical protein